MIGPPGAGTSFKEVSAAVICWAVDPELGEAAINAPVAITEQMMNLILSP